MVVQKILRRINLRLVGRLLILAFLFGLLGTSLSPVQADNLTFDPDWGVPMYVGESWSLALTASGGTAPYSYQIISGSVPGVKLTNESPSAAYAGKPTATGSYPVSIRVTDSAETPATITASYTFVVMAHTGLELSLVSGDTEEEFRVGDTVWVLVQMGVPAGVIFPLSPALTVNVSTGSGPSCIATLDQDGFGECALTFSSSGSYTVKAVFGGTTYFETSSDSKALQMQASNKARILSAGRNHTCMLDLAGKIQCWGKNDYYSIKNGDGSLISDVTTGANVYTHLTSGGYHTCAIDTLGVLHCWGDATSIISDASIPNVVNGKTLHYIFVNAGDDHVCAIDTRHKLHCWGEIPAEIASGIPTMNVRAVSVGNVHNCVIALGSNRVSCWGSNSNSQLNVPANLEASKIAVGNTHSCAIRSSDSHVICWGTPAITFPAATKFKQISSGANYTCGLSSADAVICSGTSSVVNGAPAGSFDTISAGLFHSCGLKNEAGGPTLKCWGDNTFNQAPQLSLTPLTVPVFLPLNQPWSQTFLPSGGSAPFLLTADSGLPSGITLNGQLLSGTPTVSGSFNYTLSLNETFVAASSPYPLRLTGISQTYSQTVKNPATTIAISSRDNSVPMGSPVNVAVIVTKSGGVSAPTMGGTVTITGTEAVSGRSASCTAVVSENAGHGEASCPVYFGEAGASQSITAVYDGDDFYRSGGNTANTTTTITPIEIQPSISMGTNFGCSLDSQGKPYCWGLNDSGQTQPYNYIFSQISSGNAHVCGLGVNSQIYCWGWNGYGLVTGSNTSYGFAAVTSGDNHTCGLSYFGTISCWGSNTNGQKYPPMRFDYASMDAGSNHSCAITRAGAIYCWGLNDSGQSSPPGGAPFHGISAGGKTSCALNSSDAIVCWGGTSEFRSAIPTGSYNSVSVGKTHACALDYANNLHCWGDTTATISGSYGSVSSGNGFNCALTTTTDYLKCWGNNNFAQAPVINIQPVSLPVLQVNQLWSRLLTASGARSANFSYLSSGSLPPGLSLANNGTLFGTPTTGNDYNFTVRVVEADRSPALMQEINYSQRVKGDSVVSVSSVLPADPQTGQAVTISVNVSAAANNLFAQSATGIVKISVNGTQVCEKPLAAGNTECIVFFTEPGPKTIAAIYIGDERFLPASSTASPYLFDVSAFNQMARVASGGQATYLHHANGSLTCLGVDCQLPTFSGLYTHFGNGNNLACGLKLDGTLLCRRDGVVNQINGQFIDLAVGYDHYCAIDVGGQLHCWGDNSAGQSSPPVGSYSNIFSGRKGSCAIKSSDGQTVCWGNLGLAVIPTDLFSKISVGDGFACGLNAGEIQCWGADAQGQLDVPIGNQFVDVTAGDHHTCALDDAGLLHCWGADQTGQLVVPYGVYSALDAFGNHTCAIRGEGEITCWGDNPNAVAPQIMISPFSSNETVVFTYWEHFFNPRGGTRPYQASVVSGSLPAGVSLEDDITISPAGVVAYGTPTHPGLYQFVIRWKDSSSPQLVRDVPYQLMITGADLEVKIVPAYPTTALKSNQFYFDYVLTNHTPLAIPGVRLDIDLPAAVAGWEDLELSGLDGCLVTGNSIHCNIDSFPSLGSLTLRVSGMVNGALDEVLTTSAKIESVNPNWPEIHSIDNMDEMSVLIAYKSLILGENFDDGLSTNWKSGRLVASPSGEVYLESEYPGSQTLRLVIDPVADHKRLNVRFDLLILGDWQGNGESGISLPALFDFGLTGENPVVHTTFCNLPECNQAYPGNYPAWNNPTMHGAIVDADLGYEFPQARYQLELTFDHTVDVLDMTWLAENLPEGARFGIDNVEVLIDSGWRRVYLPMLMR